MRFVGEIRRADSSSRRYLRTRANQDLDARIRRIHLFRYCQKKKKNRIILRDDFISINILFYTLKENTTNNIKSTLSESICIQIP